MAELLAPSQSDFQLTNALGFGQCSSKTSVPELFALVNASSPLFNFDGSFNLSAWLGNVTFSGGYILKYDVAKFRRLSLSTLLSDGLSAAVPLNNLSFLSLAETFESIGLNLSLGLESTLFNSTQVMFTTASSEILPTVAQSILSWTLTSAKELANGIAKAALSGRIRNKVKKDTSSDEDTDNSAKVTTALLVATAVFLLANGVFVFQRWCVSRRAM